MTTDAEQRVTRLTFGSMAVPHRGSELKAASKREVARAKGCMVSSKTFVKCDHMNPVLTS
jgi:hypothetical protein